MVNRGNKISVSEKLRDSHLSTIGNENELIKNEVKTNKTDEVSFLPNNQAETAEEFELESSNSTEAVEDFLPNEDSVSFEEFTEEFLSEDEIEDFLPDENSDLSNQNLTEEFSEETDIEDFLLDEDS